MKKIEIPVYCQFCMSVEQAAAYFYIGESKLRRLLEENRDAKFILYNGNRILIKRKLFEDFVNELQAI